ncbi:MAG: hypothetical protein NTY48_05025 [Candidatus Diapherotrites archaeon]|nr:hypothetical protein [Candidatus Diapherotrites archaeon]
MVLRKVPPSITRRIRTLLQKEQIRTGERFPPRAEKLFLKLPSADHRHPDSEKHRKYALRPGCQVRKLRMKGKEGIIIKTATARNAKTDIHFVRRFVSLINARKPKGFILLKPKAEHAGPFIIMTNTDYPSVNETQNNEFRDYPSPRGKQMLKKIAEQTRINEETIQRQIQKQSAELTKLAEEIKKQTKFPKECKEEALESRNLLLVGYKEGKPVFCPLIDPW